MIIKTTISSSYIAIQRTCSRLLCLTLLWSSIAHRFAIALITLKADNINDEENRASYYPRGVSGQPSTHPPIGANRPANTIGHDSYITLVETAAGAVLPHYLIYELAVEYKHIPRVSLLTCQDGSATRRLRKQTRTSINIDTLTILRTLFAGKNNRLFKQKGSDGGNISSSYSRIDRRQRLEGYPPKEVLIKVLRIDLLINEPFGESVANKKRSNFAGRGTMKLEAFLRSEALRQFVVLDLSCGIASRKVIEMASNKGLFSSSYHWLLIEDYTFNRQGNATGAGTGTGPVDTDGDVGNDFHLPQDVVTEDDSNAAFAGSSTPSKSKRDNKINNIIDDIDDNDNDDENDDEDDNSVASDSRSSSGNVEENNFLIEKFLEKINININTELILAKRINGDQDSKEDYYMLYDVWNPGLQYGGSLNITKIGKFSKDTGLRLEKWYRQTNTVIRRMDMKNARIRCMIVVTNKNRTDSLEDYLTQQYDTHLDSMNRFNFALLSHVRDLFNFSLVMSHTPSWGYLKNGKFDGMIGALVRREADIGGSPIFFRIERAKVIDYTTRTWIARPCFIFRHPRTFRLDQIVFLQPFSNDVWILIAICGGVTITILFGLASVEKTWFDEDSSKSSRRGNKNAKLAHSNRRKKDKNKANLRAEDDRCRVKKRQIDIKVSSFTQNNGNRRDGALGLGSPLGGGRGNATTLRNEEFNGSENRGQVLRDYGGGSYELSAIDCIDYGVGFSGPIGAVVLHNNDSHAGGAIRGCTWKASFICWKNFYYRGGGAKDRVEMILESLMFYIGSICQQGMSFSTNLFSGRCVVFTSLLSSFCIYQFYSASIVGTLLMEKPKTIETLRDVVHSSLEIGIEDIVYNRDYFLHTKDPDAIKLYAKKVITMPANMDQTKTFYKNTMQTKTNEAPNWYDPENGVAKIKQGGFAFHVDVATAYKIISDTFTEKEICELTEIQLFPPQKMVNIVQKGSPLRKMITYGVRCTQADIIHRTAGINAVVWYLHSLLKKGQRLKNQNKNEGFLDI